MSSYACGVVTFFPDEESIKRIIRYSKIFDKVFVYDNSLKNIDIFRLLDDYDNIQICINRSNDGLSVAYNFLVNQTKSNFDFLCIMDQDSEYSCQDIKFMMDYINNHELDDVVAIGPNIIYRNNKNKIIREEKSIDKKFLISSGSFLNLNILKQSDVPFDQSYFIDRVDTDFCTNYVRKGYRILEYQGSKLFQTLGTPIKGLSASNHSYKRHYYMFRNRLYYNSKFIPNKGKRYVINLLQITKQCVRIILIENDKVRKLKQLNYAIYDYRHCNMGKGRYEEK